MNRRTEGFTLVEVLVAIAITGIIFLIIAGVNDGMTKGSRKLASSNQVAQEGQNVQRLLAGRIAEAVYVYPAEAEINLGGGNGVTTNNSIGGNNNWKVNEDPIVAMIVPPREQNGEYRFVAYYAIQRKPISESDLSPSSKPSVDPLNENAWVLMQYSSNLGDWKPRYDTPSQGIAEADLPKDLGQGSGSVLADYIQAQEAGDLFNGVQGGDDCLVFCVRPPTRAGVNDGVVDVRFRMEQKYNKNTQSVVIPGRESPEYLGARVSPRNWFIPNN